jgi:transcriptional regulator with XRE-family HTH domain
MGTLDTATFRRALRIAMERAGIRSVVELAERSYVSRNTIYAWGTSSPHLGELSKVAGVLDVPTAYLVDALEGRLWPDPQTREPITYREAVEAEVERAVRLTIERIVAEARTPTERDRRRAR